MIDFFGRAYGWSKSQVNEIYIEEALILINNVKEENLRKKADILMGYMISVSSGFNPNKEILESLHESYSTIMDSLGHGKGEVTSNSNKPYWEVTELDRSALQRAKAELQKVRDSKR